MQKCPRSTELGISSGAYRTERACLPVRSPRRKVAVRAEQPGDVRAPLTAERTPTTRRSCSCGARICPHSCRSVWHHNCKINAVGPHVAPLDGAAHRTPQGIPRIYKALLASACPEREGRPAAGPDDDRRRCGFAPIQHRYRDKSAPCRIAAWTPPRLGPPFQTGASRHRAGGGGRHTVRGGGHRRRPIPA